MQPIPLPGGNTGLRTSPKLRQELKNLYLVAGENSALSLRPGVDSIAELSGVCRGLGLYRNQATGDEELYGVFGQRLVRITISIIRPEKRLIPSYMKIDDLGEMPGAGECLLVGGFTRLCIIQVGGLGFTYSVAEGLQLIDDPLFLPSVSMDYDSGRFVFVPKDGSPMFWSKLDDPSAIYPGNYADAEREPDPNKACKRIKDTVYLLGTRSIQGLDYDASLDTYVPQGGESAAVGYVGGMTPFGEVFAFVGQGTNGGFDVYVMGQEPVSITNDYVAELINAEYSLPELINMRGEYAVIEGTQVLVFYFPRHTLAFSNGGWSFWQSGISGYSVNTWRISHMQYAYGYIFTGDSIDGNVGVLRNSGVDYSGSIEYMLKTFIRWTSDDRSSIRRISLDVTMGSAGISSDDAASKAGSNPQAGLSISRDGVVFPASPKYINLGGIGDYARQAVWCGPFGSSRDGYTVVISGYSNTDLTITGVNFE